MLYAGIDIGSRTIKVVIVDDQHKILHSLRTDTLHDPLAQAIKLLNGVNYDRIMATGYGRNLLADALTAKTVTEIKAHAKGARACFPEANAVLDIGGQDSKAIALFQNGNVKRFEMNDRCAAGTGKFLEIMARSLGYELDHFGEEALLAQGDIQISSMCTVFAESEVTSLIAKGVDRRQIARGVHASAIRRAVGMVHRVCPDGMIVFTGGVAKNACMQELLQLNLACPIRIPEDPQRIGALGAALLVME